VPEGEITEIPIAGADYINGVEVSAEDQSGQPVDFLSDVELTIPIPLGITSIQAVGGASGKSPSRVTAPDLLSVYQYNEQSHSFSEFAAAALNEDATAYTLTISEMGTYCLFGTLVLDYDPPVWLGAEGVQSASVVGDNLVDVSFGTAQDTSDPVTYNVYFSTTTPVDVDTAQKLGGFLESPARIDAVRGAADYYFVVRAQDFAGNEEENTVETHVFVPRPNDSLFLTTDKGVYEVGDFIYLTANVKAVKNKVFQLNAVRVTFTPLIYAGAGSITLGSFFDYHDGMFFPAPIIPVEGNPSFIEFNVSFAQASKEAPAGKSGDLFEFKFRTMKAGYLKFGLPADPAAPLNPYHFYTSVASKTPQRFTWLQGCSVKIVQPGSLPATGS
jgi:hypothetical protein